MADALALDLVDKGLTTNQLVLTVGYDRENLDDPSRAARYKGPVTTDRYGRKLQEAMLDIKKKYGKNAILKGMNLEEGATAMERNQTIGGHHA